MSDLVFPTLSGQKINIKRRAIYKTKVQESASGKELRASFWSTPRYRYSLTFAFLRSRDSLLEYQTLADFVGRHQGQFETFLFQDPEDYTVTDHLFGIGDGTTTAFQLQRRLVGTVADPTPTFWPGIGSGYEPVYNGTVTSMHLEDDYDIWTLFSTSRTNKTLYSTSDPGFTGSSVYDGKTPSVIKSDVQDGLSCVGVTIPIIPQAYVDVSGGYATCEASGTNNASMFTSGVDSTWYCFIKLSRALTTTESIKIRLKGAYTWYGDITINATNSSQYLTWGKSIIDTATPSSDLSGRWVVHVGSNIDSPVTVYLTNRQVETGVTVPGMPITTTGVTASRTDYAISSTGLVTFAVPPADDALLTWTGTFYRRVRFASDEHEMERFLSQVWEQKTLELITVKP